MTHDELLVEIDIQLRHLPSYFHENDKTILGMKALRAVVELHKPNQVNCCTCCPYDSEYDGHFYSYPCPTIQAIEKELE